VAGSPTRPVMPNPVVLWKMSPQSPVARGAGGCQVVGAGAGPRPPELGRNWAQTEAQGGWLGAGPAGGKGAAASQRLLFYQESISAVRPEAGLSGFN
jgi:hypothetical protein